jgi:ABC-type glycerol-3-phosphate transport system substrate-binding protein
MKLRLCRFLLSAATFAGIVCSVSSGTAQDSVKNSVQGPVPSGNVTFSFWGIASQPWQVMIDDFQKTYPNLKVKWTKYSTDEMKQAVRVASSAGKMSDAWFNWGGSLASPYEEGGHALELTPQLIAEYGVDKHIVMTSGRANSQGLPNESHSSGYSSCQPSRMTCRNRP